MKRPDLFFWLFTVSYAFILTVLVSMITGCGHTPPAPTSLDTIKSCKSACRMGVIRYVDDNLTCECK